MSCKKTAVKISKLEDVYDLVLDNMKIVERVLQKHFGSATLDIKDDLRSEGYIGLIWSAQHFDANRNIKFGTYAVKRIHGQMLDWLRTQRPNKRNTSIERRVTVHQQPDNEKHQGYYTYNHIEARNYTITTEMLEVLGCKLHYHLRYRLGAKNAAIFVAYYTEGKRMHIIADELRLTESRVCQILQMVKKQDVLDFMVDNAA